MTAPALRSVAGLGVGLLLGVGAGCDAPPREPGGAGESGLVLTTADVRVIGTTEAIATVRDLEVLPDGEVWVLNSVEPLFIGFGADGNPLGAHGLLGGGPEEFGAAAGFLVGGVAGEAWVFDWQRHAMVQVSRPGESRRQVALPTQATPPGSVSGGMNLASTLVRTSRLGDELILPRKAPQTESDVFAYWLAVWSADLVALLPGTDSVRTVVSLAEKLGDPSPHVQLGDGFPPFPLWYRLWAVCADSEIRVYDRLRNELRGFGPDGAELEPISLPPPRYTEVTHHQFARVTFDLGVIERMGEVGSGNYTMSSADSARIIREMIQRLTAPPDQLANLLPRYVDFRCADDGTQWIQPLDVDVGGLKGGTLWLRITADGQLSEVHLPERFDPYRFTSDRIWGVQRNELDVASVAWVPTR